MAHPGCFLRLLSTLPNSSRAPAETSRTICEASTITRPRPLGVNRKVTLLAIQQPPVVESQIATFPIRKASYGGDLIPVNKCLTGYPQVFRTVGSRASV